MLRETRRTPTGEVDLARLSAFERDAYTRSILREDEIKRRRGELLDSTAVEAEFGWYVATVARELETLPDLLERSGLDGRSTELAEACIDRVREQLYERLAKKNGSARS